MTRVVVGTETFKSPTETAVHRWIPIDVSWDNGPAIVGDPMLIYKSFGIEITEEEKTEFYNKLASKRGTVTLWVDTQSWAEACYHAALWGEETGNCIYQVNACM